MKTKYLYCIIIILLSSQANYGQNRELNKKIIHEMREAINANNQIAFTLQRKEREIDGDEFISGKFYSKLTVKPFKMYIKNFYPSPGSEILYVDGWNNNKALINPNAFPYICLSFEPENSLVLAGGHHCIKEAGFKLMSRMFEHYEKVYGQKLYDYIVYNGIFKWNDRKCHKVTVTYPDYRILNFKCKKGDNLYKIADRMLLNVSKLRELNPKIDDTDYLEEGQTIKITNVYGEKAILLIDIENKFPIYQEIHDKKGLYEKYMYLTLDVNNSIPNEEFSRDYKDYNF